MSGMQHIPDPYRVLGVQRAASPTQIKAAHRGLAKRYHPDAPEGDTARFLAVQEAYLLLSDPLRRRDWDARHAPGPVRAGEGTTRGRGRAAAGRWTREDTDVGTRRGPRPRPPRRAPAAETGPSRASRGKPSDGSSGYDAPDQAPHDGDEPRRGPDRWSASGRDPSTRSYTWSAEGVPWWEDFPGPRRAPRGGESPPRRAGGAAAASDPGGLGSAAGGPATVGGAPGGPAAEGPARPGEPDVYSRSSGAAWSSAARRYFRQADSDLPSRGVFRRQGTQYVTGARAREAADTDAHAAPTGPIAPPGSAPRSERDGVLRPRPGPTGPRQAFDHEPATPPRDPPRQPRSGTAAAASTPAPTTIKGPASSEPSTAANVSGTIPSVRKAIRGRSRRGTLAARRAASPTAGGRARIPEASPIARRVAEASLAWLPVAAAIGYGAPALAGCSALDGRCPEVLPALQTVLAVLTLALLVAFPRVARIGAVATVVALSVAVPLVAAAALSGALPPTPSAAVAALSLVALAYLIGGGVAARRGATRHS